MLQLNRHLSELWCKCDSCSELVPAVKEISSKHLLLKENFSMVLSFPWLDNLNVTNWTNGSLVARMFGMLFWNEGNPGFYFLFIRPGFWSEER